MHGNVPPAAGGETFEQAFQYLCAGRAIVADAFHQLPALLPHFKAALGLADLNDIILRDKQHAQEVDELLRPAAIDLERTRDLVEILHADQLAGEMQQVS